MANPITPAALKGFVPAVAAKVCDALVKALLGFPAAVYRWYAWAFNADATPSNALKQGIIPPGFIMEAATVSDLATDWLICNGQSVSKDTYPELYAAIGTVFGGDGSPNFMVPNIVDRFIVGVGANALGATGGENAHVLTAAEIGPSAAGHTHVTGRFEVVDNDDFQVVIAANGETGPSLNANVIQGAGGSGSDPQYGPLSNGTGDYATTGPAISSSDTSAVAHENRPPFIALKHFIKT